MFASGIPTAERPQAKRYYLLAHGSDAKEEHANAWRRYKDYLRTTSILIPIPPAIYTSLPSVVKKTLLLDFPMYQFDERVDGPVAVMEDRQEAGAQAHAT